MMTGGSNRLNSKRAEINALNVFPVPDGDTGTNMSLTLIAAAGELWDKGGKAKLGDAASLAANGALRGARGNSGVITSQLIRGLSKELAGMESAGAAELAAAMRRGVKTAYKAVMKPKEGTILTVAAACADAAEALAQDEGDVSAFLAGVIEAGNAMLAKTTDMLPQLKQAGVVDAGGAGLIAILEGWLEALNTDGEISLEREAAGGQAPSAAASAPADITYGYCTEFFINAGDASGSVTEKLKKYLETVGDSIVAVGTDEVVKVHVHTDHPGDVLERALLIGEISGIKIDNMRIQHKNIIDFGDGEQAPAGAAKAMERKKTGFAAVCAGDGMADIFRALGADAVIEGGQTMNPSAEDILRAVESIAADNVYILPNNKNIILAAEQAAKLARDVRVTVVPSRTMPEGIAAILAYDEGADAAASAEAMKEAASAVVTASVTYAVHETTIDGRKITEGDILGLIGSGIAVVAKSIQNAAKTLLDKAVAEDSSIITIFYGGGVTQNLADELVAYAEAKFPDCEVELQYGGQPLYYYIISVE